ncbi:hypothetical protein [Hydrogenophaga sp. H7]|uniref:hypothetical protein n=1 Tax=Hydrogenophaga sp. H7 TaxID=1882399 RepID=UPI00117BA129|nr:hypothetical protein [Hydrogenophaga sp. H7]
MTVAPFSWHFDMAVESIMRCALARSPLVVISQRRWALICALSVPGKLNQSIGATKTRSVQARNHFATLHGLDDAAPSFLAARLNPL